MYNLPIIECIILLLGYSKYCIMVKVEIKINARTACGLYNQHV